MYATVVRRSLVVLSAALLLVIAAAPAAHAQNPPKGDDLADAVKVKLNARKTVKNVQHASTEGPATEQASCDDDVPSTHSVWFRFSLPSWSLVDIDSGGTILNGESASHSYVALSVHAIDEFGDLLEQDCTVGSLAHFSRLELERGNYVVRIANDTDSVPTRPSQYRISIRLRYAVDLLSDSSFDQEPLGRHWKVRKAGNPPKVLRVCDTGCSVRFDGVAGGRIQQKVAVSLSAQKWVVGDVLAANALINATPVSGSDVTISLQITYSDGTPKTKVSATRHITVADTVLLGSFGSILAEVASKNVRKIVVKLSSPQDTDTFTVTNATLTLYAGSSIRGVLPAP